MLDFGDVIDAGKIIHDSNFNLTDEMDSKIVGLLRSKNNDMIAMYAAKLIEFYQKKIEELSYENFWLNT